MPTYKKEGFLGKLKPLNFSLFKLAVLLRISNGNLWWEFLNIFATI